MTNLTLSQLADNFNASLIETNLGDRKILDTEINQSPDDFIQDDCSIIMWIKLECLRKRDSDKVITNWLCALGKDPFGKMKILFP